MKYLRTLLLSIMAGIAIGIGGTVFLSLDNKIIGSLLFTCGLYTICTQGLNIFTGKVGYLVNNDKSYLLDLVIIWTGNFIGTFLTAQAILYTRVFKISEIAMNITSVKLGDSLISLFILGIFCGLLMYIAVDGYKKTSNPIILFVCVMTFILCGFEHCIADMYYFAISGMINIDTMMILLVITAGNTLGGIMIPLINKIK